MRTLSLSRCSLFFLNAYRISSSRTLLCYFGMFIKTALLFCFPFERDLSERLFLLMLWVRLTRLGLRECTSLSVTLEWLGKAVLLSLIREVKASMSFSSIILLRLQSFSSWFKLKESSLTRSVSPLSFWLALLLISLTQIYIFLLISSLSLSYRSYNS